MEKILTKTEKLRYAHWSIYPGMFFLISPYLWFALILLFLIISLTIDPVLSFYGTLSLGAVWYGKSVYFLLSLLYLIFCFCCGFGIVYLLVLLYYFFFDKDEISQKHFKSYHICKNYACIGCDKKDKCPAAPEL